MKQNEPVHSGDLVRVPGLYRRWELPEILKNHSVYRIEKAGAHQDGTPLVAIYADHCGDQENNADAEPDSPGSPLPATPSLRRE